LLFQMGQLGPLRLGIVTSLFEVFGEEDTLSGADFLGLFKYLTVGAAQAESS
jgi:hypothetical protein